MLKPSSLVAASTFAALIGASSAAHAGEVQCHANKEYHVAVQTYDEDAGSQLAVTALKGKKKPTGCVFNTGKADLMIGEQGDPLWFEKLSGKFLILRRSTGPQGDLVVYNLATRQQLLDVPADDYELQGNTLLFWERAEVASKANCPDFAEHQANGMGSVVAVRKSFDLEKQATSAMGERRCDATQ